MGSSEESNDPKDLEAEVQRKKEKHDEAIMESLWGGKNFFLPLPFDIVLNIFSRFPPEEILIFKQVLERRWHQIFKLTHFADLHLKRMNGSLPLEHKQTEKSNGTFSKVSFLYLKTMERSSPLYYSEYDEIKNTYVVTRVNHPPIKKRCMSYALVGSCNGLVCFSIASAYNVDDSVSIYNPITREFLYLPRLEIPSEFLEGTYKGGKSYLKCHMVNGFGFHPPTGEYKVVRICYVKEQTKGRRSKNKQALGRVQVCTLGTRKQWRDKGEISYFFHRNYGSSRGMYVDGFLYWMDNKEGNIVAFDLGVEEFNLLPAPPCFATINFGYFHLQVIGGCLCVVKDTTGEGVDIWSFKKENSEWESMFKMKINLISRFEVNWPITLLKNGGVLLRYLSIFVRYDTKTSTWEKFPDQNSDLVEAIPHIHSFVPLKALEQNNMKRKRR